MKRFIFLFFYGCIALTANAQNPIAYYPFNGNANEALGTTPGINGTVNGAVLTTGITGAPNTAYSFNDNNWIDFTNNNIFNFGNSDYTISIWLKYISNQPDGYSMIFCKDGYNTPGYQAFTDYPNVGVILYRTPSSGNSISSNQNGLVNDGQWHHHVYMRKGADLFFYVDAVLRGSQPGGATGNLSNNYPFQLGGNQDVPTFQSFRGSMDELRLYNRALTAQEITNLSIISTCNTPAPTITASGPLSFNLGGSVTLTSSLATGNIWNTGETTQSITVTTSGGYSVLYTDGNGCNSASSAITQVVVNYPEANYTEVMGNNVTLDGTNDYINCGNNAAYNFTTAFTLETWVKLTSFATVREIIQKGGSVDRLGYQLRLDGSSVNFIIANNSGLLDMSFALSNADLNNWMHITAVYDGSNMRLYKNGILKISRTAPFVISYDAGPFVIGRRIDNNWFFAGVIDEVRAWNIARNINEINGSMNNPLTGNETGLVGYWDMNRSGQGAGLTVTNKTIATGAALNGTTFGTVSTPIFTGCINPAPTVTASGPTAFCQGGSVTLTSNATTGNHLWSNGETTQSIIVINSGNYSVTNTNESCTSPASSSIQVIVVSPLAIPTISSSTGTTTICAPNSIVLTSSALTGNLWSNGAITRSITVNSSGTFTVSVTNSCGTNTSLPVTLVVNPRPPAPTITPSGPNTFCNGGSLLLSSNYATGNLWNNGTAQSPGTSQSITVTTSGSFVVFYQDANGCYSAASATTQVTVNPKPNPPVISNTGLLTFCAGSSVVLTSSILTGILWSNGSTAGSISVFNSGSYTVNTTNAFGCTSNNAVPKVVTVNPIVTYYQDIDGDGYGNAAVSISDCIAPSGYTTNNTDCNDNDNQVHPGRPEILNNIDDDCDGLVDEGISCNASDVVFSKTFGGSGIDEAKDIKQTADGGYIVVGSTSSNNGNVLGNRGNFDCWVVKLSAAGNLQWQKTFGGSGRDVANSVIIANDGNYVVAGSTTSVNGDVTLNNGSSDFWIFKIDQNGNLLWQKNYGGTGADEANSVIQTTDNGYAVCGFTTSNLGNGDFGILKLDASGNLQWQKILGGSSIDEATSLAQLNDGHIVVAGYTFSNNNDVSGYMGNGDGWIVKLDLAGNSIWNKTFGNASSQKIFSIVPTTDGGFIFAGSSNEPIGGPVNALFYGENSWVLKSTAAGVVEWQKLIGTSATERLYSIKQKNDGSYIATGESNQSSYLLTGFNYLIVTLTQGGTINLNSIFGGSNDEGASCIIPTTENGLIVAGKSNSNNNQVGLNKGQFDFWVLKLSGPNTVRFYRDQDGDGYGNVAISLLGCSKPIGYVADSSDCDDTRNLVYPGAIELCGNNIDENCNGIIDEPSDIPAITEIIGPQNVCGFIDANTVYPVEYSVPSVPNATSYVWRVAPTMIILSGQGTSTISVYIGTGFSANPDKMISVYAVSPCDTSNTVYTYPKAQIPGTPSAITALSTDICSVVGSSTPITYKIQKVPGATSYIWNLPLGASGISHPAGAGVNDTIVEITYSNSFTSGNLTVKAYNNCGTGGTRSLLVTRNAAATPSPISGPRNACPHIGTSGTLASYTTAAQGSNSFTWTVPANATNIIGQGTNSISFRYPTGFTTGTLSVAATNGCGTSGGRSLAITTLNPGTPGVIDVINTAFCPNRIFTYSLAVMPSNTTNLLWTVPPGAQITNGQGTISITVSYPPAAVNDKVTVRGTSNCSNSTIRGTPVTLPACPTSFSRGANSNVLATGEITALQEELEVNISPNPTTNEFKLQVRTTGSEVIKIRMLDMQGRTLKQSTTSPNNTIRLGSELAPGSYMIEVRQLDKMKTVKVVKF